MQGLYYTVVLLLYCYTISQSAVHYTLIRVTRFIFSPCTALCCRLLCRCRILLPVFWRAMPWNYQKGIITIDNRQSTTTRYLIQRNEYTSNMLLYEVPDTIWYVSVRMMNVIHTSTITSSYQATGTVRLCLWYMLPSTWSGYCSTNNA